MPLTPETSPIITTPRVPSPMRPAAPPEQPTNQLVKHLPADVKQRVEALTTRVPLERDAELAQAGEISPWTYLPLSGVVSLQTMTEDGDTIEVAMIGREGIVGFPLAAMTLPSPHTAVVIIRGDALRIKTEVLQAEFDRSAPLQRALLRYWHSLMEQMMKGSACHRFHSTRQRLARWLLEASDRTQSATIEITQERLAQALGIQRTGVTTASVSLQDLGVVRARHGRITVIHRERLRDVACDCYGAHG